MTEVDPDAPRRIVAVVICRTDGCAMNGQEFTVPLYENPVEPKWRAQCASCGNNITDITEVTGD